MMDLSPSTSTGFQASPYQPGERITRVEFARRLGVNRKTVTRWIQNGRLTLGADGLLDFDAANRERLATESPLPKHQAMKARFEAERRAKREAQAAAAALGGAGGPSADGPPASTVAGNSDDAGDRPAGDLGQGPGEPSAEGLGIALKLETYKLQKAKAEQANLELDKAAGLLVERAEVDYLLADFGNTLRGLVEGLPDRLAPTLAGHQGDVSMLHKLIEEAARELLDAMAEHMTRKLDGALK